MRILSVDIMGPAFLLLSDYGESLNGKLYLMGGGWQTLRFVALPSEYQFAISLGIDVPWDETNRRHALALRVEGPDGRPLGEPFSLDFEAGRPPGSLEGQDQRIVLSLQARFRFEAFGQHAVVAEVNGDELALSRFYVVEIPRDRIGASAAGL